MFATNNFSYSTVCSERTKTKKKKIYNAWKLWVLYRRQSSSGKSSKMFFLPSSHDFLTHKWCKVKREHANESYPYIYAFNYVEVIEDNNNTKNIHSVEVILTKTKMKCDKDETWCICVCVKCSKFLLTYIHVRNECVWMGALEIKRKTAKIILSRKDQTDNLLKN